MSRIKMSSDDIFNKEFKKSTFGGFNRSDVDEFLNSVIEDYETFEKEVVSLKTQNEELRKENFKIKMESMKVNKGIDETDFPIKEEVKVDTTMEKRIIDLEREVAVIKALINQGKN